MPKKTEIEERDAVLLKAYFDVLTKHGKYAKMMPKNELYREAAVGFFIDVQTAGRIIRNMLKLANVTREVLSDEEKTEILEIIKGRNVGNE